MFMHPHQIEEIESQEGDHPDSASYDRREALMGAAWNNDRENEWLLTSRDVWVRNPGFTGTPGPHPEDAHEEDEYS